MGAKKLLFSVTRKDFERQTFRSGGKGGQNQNKVESGVRFIHKASGARGEARDSRDQKRNEQSAFERCVASPVFQAWFKIECARRMGQKIPETPEQIRERVNRQFDIDMAEGRVLVQEYEP